MSKYGRLFLLFLALSVPLSLASAQVYEITEAELTALEEALKTSKMELSESLKELSMLKSELITLQTESIALQTELMTLSESYREYAIAEQKKRTLLVISTSIAGALAVVFGIASLF